MGTISTWTAGKRSQETIDALLQLGLECQAEILRAAVRIWESKERQPAVTAQDFLEGELERDSRATISRYEECNPTTNEGMERYLGEHQATLSSWKAPPNKRMQPTGASGERNVR